MGVANIDDDHMNGAVDWDDAGAAGEADDDLFVGELADGDDPVELALSGDVDPVRVWLVGALLLDADTTEATVIPGDSDLLVEFAGFLDAGVLTVGSDEVALLSAPLLLTHHLQMAELETVVEISAASGAPFSEGFEEVLGDALISGPLADHGLDVWIQDDIEFATLTAPGHRMDVIIDSVRSTNGDNLDPFAEDLLQQPDVAVATWGEHRGSSSDSFGNLEVTPPRHRGRRVLPLRPHLHRAER